MKADWQRWEPDMARSTLREHELVCEQRYKEIERRLTNLETKLDNLHSIIDDFRTFFVKIAIRSGLGIFAIVTAAVFAVKL